MCVCVCNRAGDRPVMGEPEKGLLACRYTQPMACRLSPSPRRVSQCLPLNYPSFHSRQGLSQITAHCPPPIGLSSRGSTFQSAAHCGQRAELGGPGRDTHTRTHTQTQRTCYVYLHAHPQINLNRHTVSVSTHTHTHTHTGARPISPGAS